MLWIDVATEAPRLLAFSRDSALTGRRRRGAVRVPPL